MKNEILLGLIILGGYGAIMVLDTIFDYLKVKKAEKIRAKENEIKSRLV